VNNIIVIIVNAIYIFFFNEKNDIIMIIDIIIIYNIAIDNPTIFLNENNKTKIIPSNINNDIIFIILYIYYYRNISIYIYN